MIKWHHRFMKLAAHVATWSKDPSTQVGCILVDDHRRVVGMGYNGFPRGVSDEKERYQDRLTKYLMVQHAEANAVLNAVGKTVGASAYITHHPCSTCAGLLIQAGIKSVITNPPAERLSERFADSFAASATMFHEAGTALLILEDFYD